MRFLIKASFIAPPTQEVLDLIPAEQTRIKELMTQGVVEAVYAAADKSGAWGVWNRDSLADVEELHKTLPLHDYMKSEITLLADPA